jgi:hypothetical protein
MFESSPFLLIKLASGLSILLIFLIHACIL